MRAVRERARDGQLLEPERGPVEPAQRARVAKQHDRTALRRESQRILHAPRAADADVRRVEPADADRTPEDRLQQPRLPRVGEFLEVVAARHDHARRAQPLGVRRLEGVPRQHRHRRARRDRAQCRHLQQPHGAGADHQRPLPGRGTHAVHRVHAAREWLREHRFGVGHRVVHTHQLCGMRHEPFPPTAAEPARGPDEHPGREVSVGEVRAPRVMTGGAGRAGRCDAARLAAEQGIHDHALPHCEPAHAGSQLGDLADVLVPEHERERREWGGRWTRAERDDVGVAPADPAHAGADADPVRARQLGRRDLAAARARVRSHVQLARERACGERDKVAGDRCLERDRPHVVVMARPRRGVRRGGVRSARTRPRSSPRPPVGTRRRSRTRARSESAA